MTKIARKKGKQGVHNNKNTPTLMKPPIINILAAISLATMPAHAVIYSGSLSGAGLTGNGAWAEGSSISWTVSNEEEGCEGWNYSYNLTVLGKDISHIVIEVSDIFQQSNILGETSLVVDDYSSELQGGSNPGMPSEMRGVKLDVSGNTKDLSWSFCSDIAPVWGDFYAKDGKEPGGEVEVYVFNTGFTTDDVDPTSPVTNGSLDNHIIVPDSQPDDPGPNIPEPGTAILGAVGLLLIFRRRKN